MKKPNCVIEDISIKNGGSAFFGRQNLAAHLYQKYCWIGQCPNSNALVTNIAIPMLKLK